MNAAAAACAACPGNARAAGFIGDSNASFGVILNELGPRPLAREVHGHFVRAPVLVRDPEYPRVRRSDGLAHVGERGGRCQPRRHAVDRHLHNGSPAFAQHQRRRQRQRVAGRRAVRRRHRRRRVARRLQRDPHIGRLLAEAGVAQRSAVAASAARRRPGVIVDTKGPRGQKIIYITDFHGGRPRRGEPISPWRVVQLEAQRNIWSSFNAPSGLAYRLVAHTAGPLTKYHTIYQVIVLSQMKARLGPSPVATVGDDPTATSTISVAPRGTTRNGLQLLTVNTA